MWAWFSGSVPVWSWTSLRVSGAAVKGDCLSNLGERLPGRHGFGCRGIAKTLRPPGGITDPAGDGSDGRRYPYTVLASARRSIERLEVRKMNPVPPHHGALPAGGRGALLAVG